MRALTALLPVPTGFRPFGHLAIRVARELKLWRWRRERSRSGAPVTITRRRVGRAYMFESRRSDATPGV